MISKNLLYITGLERTGGSLMARLLEGHPEVASYPFEFRYGGNRNDFPVCDGNTNFYDFLKTHMLIDRFELFFNGKLEKGKNQIDDFKSLCDKEYFFTGIKKCQLKEIEPFEGINVVSKLFFNSMKNNTMEWDKVKYIAWHASKPISESITNLVEKDDMKFIHMVRLPFDIISSNLNRKEARYRLTTKPEIAACLWTYSLLSALLYMQNQPKNNLIVRYEDLVRNTDDTCKKISAFLGITDDPILRVPNYLGQNWRGNSSFNSFRRVSDKSLGRFTSTLNRKEINIINTICKDSLPLAGYTSKFPYFVEDLYTKKVSLDDLVQAHSRIYHIIKKIGLADSAHVQLGLTLKKRFKAIVRKTNLSLRSKITCFIFK
jgi:hypothetical protein